MSKKTLALIAGLTVLTLILVVLALNTAPKTQHKTDEGTTTTVQPTPTVPAHTTVSLSPNPVSLTNGTGTVDVMIDTSDNQVTGAQFELVYDPTVLNVTGSVKQGTFFDNALVLLNEVDRTKGRITYIIGLSPAQAQAPKTGTGTVASITFTRRSTAPRTGTSPVRLENVIISAKDIRESVLKGATGTTVNLANTSASPSGR